MLSARSLKRFTYTILLVILTSLQAACALLRPFGFFSEPQVAPAYEITSFRYAIPRPQLPTLKQKTIVQNKAAEVGNTSVNQSSKFEFKSFVDKILSSYKKRGAKFDDNQTVLASVKLPETDRPPKGTQSAAQIDFCNKIDQRLSSISLQECMSIPFIKTGRHSLNGSPIMRSEFSKLLGVEPIGRVLLLGGVHGDELSSVSIVFEWMQFLSSHHNGEFVWHTIPVMNPDGLFRAKPTRTNANGVDLNRNMPTADWGSAALKYWRDRTGSAPRKYPGKSPASEPETKWLVEEIDQFKPDMIIAVHAPHNLIDYDAPSRKNAPRKFGHLKGGLLGTFPGSLGNYAGVKRGIPVVTIELASADKAVPVKLAHNMWSDILVWLSKTIPIENKRFMQNRRYARLERS